MATPTYTSDFTYLTDAFENVYFLGSGWILPLILTFLVMIMITRDVNKWKVMIFPLLILWSIVGIPINIVILVLGGMLFVFEALSTQMGGNLISSITERADMSEKDKKGKITSSNLGKLKGFMTRRLRERERRRFLEEKRRNKIYTPAKTVLSNTEQKIRQGMNIFGR